MRNRFAIRHVCVVLFLTLLCGLAGEAQVASPSAVQTMDDPLLPPARLPFRSYESDRGLRCFYLHAITQDSNGFLWVAGEDGLFRYDGSRFVRFGLNEGMPSSVVTSLATGPKGEVWAGTVAGLAIRKGETFSLIGPDAGLAAEQINGISSDDRGRLFVAQPSGLFVAAPGGRFDKVKGWPGGPANAVAVTRRGEEVYVAAAAKVFRMADDGNVTTWDIIGVAAGENIEGLRKDGQGLVWARSTNGSLFCKKPAAASFENLSGLLPQGVSVPALELDQAGNLMVPTLRGVMRHIAGKWVSIGGIAQGFASSWRAVFEDREGSLWVAGEGVFRLLGRGAWMSWGIGEGLPGRGVWCVIRDSSRRLWLGNLEGMCLGTDIDWKVIPGTEHQLIRTIVEAPDRTLWATGTTPWVFHYDPAKDVMARLGPEQGVPAGVKWDLLIDRDNIMWMATATGLYRFNPNINGGMFELEKMPGGNDRALFRSLILDSQGRAWVAGGGGMFYRDKGAWQRYSMAEGLRRDNVAYILWDRKDNLWLAYYESLGVDRVSLGGGKVSVEEHFDITNGLNADKVYFLGEDASGFIWVGTGAGEDVIGKVGENKHDIVYHFGKSDGVDSEDATGNGFYAEPDGTVYVGTSSGVSRFTGSVASMYQLLPIAQVVTASLGGKPVSSGESALVCKAPQSTFEVSFSGLSFVNEDRISYQVRLIGLEGEWRFSRVSEARYPMLPPGNYRFEVRARAGQGPWGKATGISFAVK